MKKAVMIIAQENFRDEELFEPKQVLEKSGVRVSIASASLSIAKGKLGAEVKPDIIVDDIDAKDFDAIIFVGGPGAAQYFDSTVAHALAQDALNLGKIVGAICAGPVILAKAGILEGKRATVFPSDAEIIKSKGAVYTARPVEKDGQIITASGPQAAREFGEEIVRALK